MNNDELDAEFECRRSFTFKGLPTGSCEEATNLQSQQMVSTGTLASVEKQICSLDEVFSLTGFHEVVQLQSRLADNSVEKEPRSVERTPSPVE